MFGANAILSKKDYRHIPKGFLQRTTAFYTLQGEAINAGTPCMFERFTGCNLNCRFCDTYFNTGDVISFEQAYMELREQYREFFAKRGIVKEMPSSLLIVLTGGEPVMQPHFGDFADFLTIIGHRVQVETNGAFFSEALRNIEVVCSPKINETTGKPIRPHIELMNLYLRTSNDPSVRRLFKFVISGDPKQTGYYDVPDWAKEWAGDSAERWDRIWLSPMNKYNHEPQKIGPNGTMKERSEVDERVSFWTPGLLDLAANQVNHERVAELALRYGSRATLQNHLYMSIP